MGMQAETGRRAAAVANAVAIGILAFFLLYHLTSFRFDVLFTDPARWVDFRQWYLFPPLVIENYQYPAVIWNDWTKPFPYLPSAILLFWPLSLFSEPVAFGIWLVIQSIAYFIVLRTSVKLTLADREPAPWLAALGAVLLCENAISWDLRTHNNNLVYLAIVLLGLSAAKPWLSGLLLAVSANLKIYSGVLLALFAWRREYPRALWFAICGAALAVILPSIVYSPSGFLRLVQGFVGQAAYLAPVPHENFPPDLLRGSIATLTGAGRASTQTGTMLLAVQAAWLVLLCLYFYVVARAPFGGPRERVADVVVALLAPLPLSPWFAPYHSVVMYPACVLLLTLVADKAMRTTTRVVIGTALAAMAALGVTFPDWQLRAGKHLLLSVLIVISLLAFRAAAIPSAEKEKAPREAGL